MQEPTLEAVYYASPIPGTALALTHMALVFDRIHFPHIYLPLKGYDPEWVEREAARIAALPPGGFGDGDELVAMLRFVRHAKTLDGFCAFTGEAGVMGGKEEGADELVKQLDIAIFGPPKPNFFPMHFGGHAKGLTDDGSVSMNYPGRLHYHAQALIYAARNGIPIINDHPGLPIPEPRPGAFKNNVQALSTIAAMQCVALAVPRVKALNPEQLMEMRAEFEPYLKPFRRAVLRLAGQLNTAISEGADFKDVEAAAKALVETEVRPQLLELKDAVEKPARGLLEKGFGLAKETPEIVTSYLSMPLSVTIAKALITVAGLLMQMKGDKAKQEGLARSPYYYLLRISRQAE
ncbi:MAG: hypothetical protein OEV08_16265 [Nitrospira sp.]|nr:hypothetical protein [Nitrospira sp.]